MEHNIGGIEIFFSPPQGSRKSERSCSGAPQARPTTALPRLISAATQWLLRAEDWPKEAESQGLSPQVALGQYWAWPGRSRELWRAGWFLGMIIPSLWGSFCPQHQVPSCSSAMVSASQWMTFVWERPHIQQGQTAMPRALSFRVASGWATTGRATPVFTTSSDPLMRGGFSMALATHASTLSH